MKDELAQEIDADRAEQVEAEVRGLRTLDGLGMLVNQGVVSIRHWFGIDVEAAAMRAKLEELFGV